MTNLPDAYYAALSQTSRDAVDRQFAEWSQLRDAVVPFIGEHAATLFSYAISHENGALPSSARLRKALIDSGENPDAPSVTEAEQSLIDWGRLLARDPAAVPAEVRQHIDTTFNDQLRLLLTAFAAQTVAGNLLEVALAVPLDAELTS